MGPDSRSGGLSRVRHGGVVVFRGQGRGTDEVCPGVPTPRHTHKPLPNSGSGSAASCLEIGCFLPHQ